MKYKVYTAVTTEPVSLAEAKLHLRLTSETFSGDTATYQSIKPGSQSVVASYGLVGTAIDVLGKTAIVNLNAGACGTGGSVAAKIQESDDNTNWSDFTGGGFTTVTEANDNAIQEKEYTGTKQYIRVVATVAVIACSFSVDVVVKSGDSTEDNLLSVLITAAREYCEGYTGRALATQTIEAYLDEFPCGDCIELPRPPLQSVTSVKYTDSAGTETTMTVTTQYLVDADSDVGRIVLPYGVSWPSFTEYPVNPIKIKYVCGYYASNLIPKSIKQAMLLLIGHWYANREAVLTGSISKEIEFAVKALLSMYRVRWF
jgi:uncharacterized phiE125 gp8 family phage protein